MMRHVLIIDDSEEIVDLVRRLARGIDNCKITAAYSGCDGLQEVTAASPAIDLLILDLSLPDIDGLEFLRQLANRSFSGGIILISGHIESVLASARRLAEIHSFEVLATLQKPFSPGELRKLIQGFDITRLRDRLVSSVSADELHGAKLVPYYQPQFDIGTGNVAGFEALIRLAMPDGPVLGPSLLFSQLRTEPERTAVALDIAELVLADMAAANRRTPNFPSVSFNFDARVLEDAPTLARFVELVAKYEIPKNQITIEVIEKSLPKSDASLLEALTRLRMAGFGLSLDDYGVGGSNHDLLRRCPFNELKLDRSLIRSGLDDPLCQKFIANAVEIANALNLRLIAEGVEDVADLEFVRNQGIEIVQGFLFRRPMPIEEAVNFVCNANLNKMAV